MHVEIDLLNNFRKLGVRARSLNGKERLRLMHAMFHMGESDSDKFHFDWKWLVKSGLSVKDFIAPTAFAFPKSRIFQMGSLYGSMSYLQITASDLSDQMLKDFLEMESSQIITIPHINPHAFRHTAASTMIANGVDIVTAANELGRATPTTTANIYAHQIALAKAKAAEARAGVFSDRDKVTRRRRNK